MSVVFFHGTVKEEFDGRWKSRHLVKQFMEHKVLCSSNLAVVVVVFEFASKHTSVFLRQVASIVKVCCCLARSIYGGIFGLLPTPLSFDILSERNPSSYRADV